ncbi:hypothetical protein QWA68_001144, partial [Fusarium oxysporum]
KWVFARGRSTWDCECDCGEESIDNQKQPSQIVIILTFDVFVAELHEGVVERRMNMWISVSQSVNYGEKRAQDRVKVPKDTYISGNDK